MIDWNKFKNGKLSVILRTKELAEDFYKKCKERGIDWNGNIDYAIWREGGVKYTYDTLFNMLVWGDIEKDKIIEYLEWGGSNKIEKTFREVIRDIKEGEVWENPENRVRRIYINGKGNIAFEGNEIDFSINSSTCVDPNSIYKLQRKEYTFEEAFKAYEEGEEIEDYAGVKYKKIDGIDHYKLERETDFNAKADANDYWFSFDEIRGKWYIND